MQVNALEKVKCLNVRIDESFALVLGTSLLLPQAPDWPLREDQAPMLFGLKPAPADKAFSACFCKRKSSVVNQLRE